MARQRWIGWLTAWAGSPRRSERRRYRPEHAWAIALLVLTTLAWPAVGQGSEVPGEDALEGSRSNVVVVLLDDMGAVGDDLWSRLPTIRSLFLDGGTVFTQAMGDTPMCCPGRASFLTGLWTMHHRVFRNDARLFRPSETIATALKRAGYFTIYAGKYFNVTPLLQDKTPPGWSRTAISDGDYYRYTSWRQGRARWFGSAARDHQVDVLRRDAIAFLRDAPRGRPLFAVLAPYAAHSGQDQDGGFERFGVPAPRHVGDPRCADVGRFRTSATDEADVADKPAYVRRLSRLPRGLAAGWPLRTTCETLLSVDEMLGAVARELDRQGRLASTVFILTSDNGMNMGLHRLRAKGSPYAAPIPLMVRWPGPAPATGQAIRRHPGLISMVDLAPTICAIARCDLGPYPTGQRQPDGIDQLRAMRDPSATMRTWTISSHPADGWHAPDRPGWYSLRTTREHPRGAWLFVRYRTGEMELYDLERDPAQLVNRARDTDRRAVRDALDAELRRRLGGQYRWP